MHLYGTNVQNFKQLLLSSLWANVAQISYGAFLGWGNEKLLKWSRSVDQDGSHAHIWYKTFKNLLLQNRMPWRWTFAGIIGDGRSTNIAKRIVVRWRLTFLRQGQVCFPMHLYGKNLQKSSPKPSMPFGWIFAYIFGNRRATKIAKIMVIHWYLTFLC